MIPPLRYLRVRTVTEAVGMLVEHRGAVVLGGGQSLLPVLAAPTGGDRWRHVDHLVDVAAIDELDRITPLGAEGLLLGAAVRHEQLAADPRLRPWGLLAAAAESVGDPQVRAMGTLGGSLATGNPRADLLLAAVALQARVRLVGPAGSREVAADQVAAVLRREEIVTGVLVPAAPDGGQPFAYQRFSHRAESWLQVAVAVVGRDTPRVAVAGLAATVVRATAVERALRDGSAAAEAAGLVADGVAVGDDGTGSAAYRRQLAEELLRRALVEVGR